MPGAAAVATAQRVGGGGRGMGDLLAAVHPLGPGGLLLLGRAGGAVRTSPAAAWPEPAAPAPASVPFQPARKESATFCPAAEAPDAARRPAACAPVLATLPRPATAPLAPPPAAAEPAWNADLALLAADVAARAPLLASLAAAGAMRAPAMTAPPTPVAAAPMATPVPAAPSCGAPDTRPVAMPGPKMPSASSASEASITTRAWSMDGSSGTVWNSANSPEPMPTMTASTSTLTPDDTTLPSTFSARKLVLFQSANGTSTKPASVVSLNSINVMKSCTASTKKQRITTNQARNSTTMGSRFTNTSGKPARSPICSESAPQRRCPSSPAGRASRSSPS